MFLLFYKCLILFLVVNIHFGQFIQRTTNATHEQKGRKRLAVELSATNIVVPITTRDEIPHEDSIKNTFFQELVPGELCCEKDSFLVVPYLCPQASLLHHVGPFKDCASTGKPPVMQVCTRELIKSKLIACFSQSPQTNHGGWQLRMCSFYVEEDIV